MTGPSLAILSARSFAAKNAGARNRAAMSSTGRFSSSGDKSHDAYAAATSVCTWIYTFIAAILLLASSCFAQDIKRPTFELDSGATVKCGFGSKVASSPMPNAYDAAGQSTSSAINVGSTSSASFYRSRIFTSWQGASSGYSAVTLNVNAQDVETNRTGSTGVGTIQYSLNGGSTWTTLITASGPGWTRQTSTVSLSASQDLSQLKVAACVQSTAGGDTAGPTETLTVFDIWTAGTTTPQGAGAGSSSGSPHRGMVVVN